ncbi:MAG: hypothetical protein EWV49_05510 [Microcystis aeruginosa Ma_QC_Ch_20071001_S25]|uniref:Uncharacterized protein n=1 Tax=Microcystis aeruginosa Ma_QC_Ch_20071001_S25D TaxID=2486250 RepID=A0A552FUM6_MICAE|nr:MAG: hypothetical protein EWV57_10405 [Microcystis aeruginosa Ma_QC_Ch_20071001_S25D]TRU52380.1 MAG: hypothetical protein EWV49_05510 [Microcystis aeruginosa Ma_QC_Ch_20071001_S25]TRU57783.1 MAG: hypothetical protein EWV90_20050 [Microcystis aeruginosa Ma_QC_Ch_20071001_M135]
MTKGLKVLPNKVFSFIQQTINNHSLITGFSVKCPHNPEHSNNPDKFSCPQPDMIEIGDLTIKTNAKFSYL